MKTVDEYFYHGNPERMQINFKIRPVKSLDGGGSIEVEIEPDDPRWKKITIDKKLYFHDIIDDVFLPADVLVDSFNKSGKPFPIMLSEDRNLQCGTSTYEGVNRLSQSQPLDAFLSGHAIFLRKLRVLVCLHKFKKALFQEKIKKIEKKFMAASAIKYLSENKLLLQEDIDILIAYNRDRNSLHDFDSGTTTNKIKKNIKMGEHANKILDRLFIEMNSHKIA